MGGWNITNTELKHEPTLCGDARSHYIILHLHAEKASCVWRETESLSVPPNVWRASFPSPRSVRRTSKETVELVLLIIIFVIVGTLVWNTNSKNGFLQIPKILYNFQTVFCCFDVSKRDANCLYALRLVFPGILYFLAAI